MTANLANVPDNALIVFQRNNPKKEGTPSHARYEASRGALTKRQVLDNPNASTRRDLRWGTARRFITIQGFIPPPLLTASGSRDICPICFFKYEVSGAKRPEAVWACGHRACIVCQANWWVECQGRGDPLETCCLCIQRVVRINPWQ